MAKPHEGLWSVRFVSNMNAGGGGVIVVLNDAVLGGDNQYYYMGKASLTDDFVNADLEVKRHATFPGGTSIFGPLDKFHLALSGKLTGNELILTGRMKENSSATISVVCSRLATLQ